MKTMEELGRRAKGAAAVLAAAGSREKDRGLLAIVAALREHTPEILAANALDTARALEAGMSRALLDRLSLDETRIQGIAAAVEEIVSLPDPVGRMDGGSVRPNGLSITRLRVPLGVVGIIYEARPNVTVDAAALCLKSGNACILRGGKEAIETNLALAGIMGRALTEAGLPGDAVQPGIRHSDDESKRPSGRPHPPGRRGAHPGGGGTVHRSGDPDRGGQLPRFCGQSL